MTGGGMMWISHGGSRYRIVYGDYSGCEKEAVDALYGEVQQYVPYVLTAQKADDVDETSVFGHTDDNFIIVGTKQSNRFLQKLVEQGACREETKKEGYSLKVFAHPANREHCITLIQGADGEGVLYGVSDYITWYINHILNYQNYLYDKRPRPFLDPFIPFEKTGAPRIEHRGLWTWGHVIYDYIDYIKNMRRCKLNTLIIWNDYAPVNAREVIEFAHRNGVKVIWGFAWGWGENCVRLGQAVQEDRTRLKKQILDIFETQYRGLKPDGIYFQSFTETNDTTIGDKDIAVMVVDWVNEVSGEFYAKYPDLWIQFGIHANSILERYTVFRRIDPRMSLVWENCGGFPYLDEREAVAGLDAYAYTDKLLSLRGGEERFGAVFKGYTGLVWSRFEPQKGPHIMGKMGKTLIRKNETEKEYKWTYSTARWINRADELKKTCRLIADAKVKDRIVTALVEDGMWECNIHVSAALLAELLWNPEIDTKELLTVLFHSGYKT
jgi:hypothetical protein